MIDTLPRLPFRQNWLKSPPVFVAILVLLLGYVIFDYVKTQDRINNLSPYYQRVAKKYCSLDVLDMHERENCFLSIESAAGYEYRFVATYSAATIPYMARCNTTVIMTIGPGISEPFEWCDDNHGERSAIITVDTFDIIADSPTRAKGYRALLETVAQKYDEPLDQTALILTSQTDTALEAKVYFGWKRSDNLRAMKTPGNEWVPW